MQEQNITGNIVDISGRKVFPGRIKISDGRITRIDPLPGETERPGLPYLCPGFVDAHVHIESSMLIPSEFARLAVTHGTVATVSDPHEIANVCGLEGVYYMIENGNKVPFKFNFGAPSCVPATHFETAGANLDASAVTSLLARQDIRYLSEMMNFPGVLQGDPEVMQKIEAAHRLGKPVDGHAPGLRGEEARKYANAGIQTDHECFTREEALDKLAAGMHILIREGSAAKNFDALADLIRDYPEKMMFCSDDKHPDSLVNGHINQLCSRAVARGMDVYNVLRTACVNPVLHYKLDVGLLRENDPADFVVLENLTDFTVLETYINGIKVASGRQSLIRTVPAPEINRFTSRIIQPEELSVPWSEEKEIPVIGALDGQLITEKLWLSPRVENSQIISDPGRDILKIVVVNRYKKAPVATAFIRNFGLQSGALASSVAHDSHNVVCVGTSDIQIAAAINLVMKEQGGISCVGDHAEMVLGLPVAGLMSRHDGYEVAAQYTAIDAMAKSMGSSLSAPFMTLSFMALLVIPHLKLSDLGLFDGDSFRFIKND